MHSLLEIGRFWGSVLALQWLVVAVLVVGAAGLLRCLPKANAATRHSVWTLVLVCSAILPLASIAPSVAGERWLDRPTASKTVTVDHDRSGEAESPDLLASEPVVSLPAELLGQAVASSALSGAAVVLAMGWSLLVMWRLTRLALALKQTVRLHREATSCGDEIQGFASTLAATAKVSKAPVVSSHPALNGPACTGWLRPSIVVPAEWPAQLSRDAQGHVLLHEMAHAARRDGVAQLLQRCADCLLPMHPATAWVSRQIDWEREGACDDWVLARTAEHPEDYGESLIESCAWRIEDDSKLLVAGCVRSTSQLHWRLKSMTSHSRSHQAQSSWFLVAALALTMTVGFIGTAWAWPAPPQTSGPSNVNKPVAQGVIGALQDTARTVLSADDSSLYPAVRSGAFDRVRRMLDAGENANEIWPGDGSPLIVASRRGHRDVVQLLLDSGAEVDLAVDGDGSPLIQAASNGDLDLAEILLSYGADVDHAGPGGDGNPLIAASLAGELEMVEFLVQRGADIDLHVEGDDTPLINAAQQGRLDVVMYLLEAGADPNLSGDYDRELLVQRTPLNQARDRGHREVARLLEARGAGR